MPPPTNAALGHTAGLSLANREAVWSTHIIATIPYPSTIWLPAGGTLDAFTTASRSLFPTGTWATATLPFNLAPALTLSGGPRDPSLVASLAVSPCPSPVPPLARFIHTTDHYI